MTSPAFIPPGWYPDPDGSKAVRYWDGHAWTEHTVDRGSDARRSNRWGWLVAAVVALVLVGARFI